MTEVVFLGFGSDTEVKNAAARANGVNI